MIGVAPPLLASLRRGEWDFEGDGGSLGVKHGVRYTRAIKAITTHIGINYRKRRTIRTRQMRGGRCHQCQEGHLNIKCAAHERLWGDLPMDALNGGGR